MLTKISFIAFIIMPTVIFSQQAKYFDAPFGGGIGYAPAWYIPDLAPINAELKLSGMPELSTSGFFTSGISGFIYIGFVKNLRVGGMGYSGSVSETQLIDLVNREVIYSLGGGGVTVDYTLPFVKDFGISIGAVIGGGSMEIELYRNTGSFNWQGIWEEFNNPAAVNSQSTITNSFWMLSPTINIDIPIYRFVVLRIGGGYQFAFNDDWTANNGQTLNDVPTDLNSNAFFIQSGIFIGFFSF